MRGLIVIVAVGCLALLAWFLTAFSNTEPTAPPQPDAKVEEQSPDANASTGTVNAAAPKAEAPAANVAIDRELVDVAPKDSQANVQVIADETKEPAANVEVLFLPPDFNYQTMTPELQALAGKDSESFIRAAGATVRTDSNGYCHVPTGERGCSLIARSGDLFAQSYVPPPKTLPAENKGVTVVTLRVDRTLNVLVLDARGQPADRVSVCVVAESLTGNDGITRWQVGTTDASGRCSRQHCQELSTATKSANVQVACFVTGEMSEAVETNLLAPPAELVLRLQPTGVVRVRVTDAQGKQLDTRYLAQGTAQLATYDEAPNRNNKSNGYNMRGASANLAENGVATFSHVSLGKYVEVRIDHFGATTGGDGPTASHPEIDFEIKEDPKDAIFTGVLLAADSQPMANQVFQIAYRGGRGMGSRQAKTDDLGRFRCNLSTWVVGKKCQLSFQLGTTYGKTPPATELEDQTVRSGINDLGRVQLSAPRVLLSGRVTRAPGVNATQPHVSIERRTDGRWSQLYNHRLTWHENDTFTLDGCMPEGAEVKLIVGKGAYQPVDAIECKVGDQDIEIALRAAGTASATFLVDDQVPLRRLLTRFLPMVTPGKKPSNRSMFDDFSSHFHDKAIDGRATMSWHGLAPGRHVLTVVCQGSQQEVVRIEGIEVTSGPCIDPRLTDIDLRGRIREIEISATGLDGSRIKDREAFVIVRNDGTEWRGYSLRTGKVQLASVSAADIFVVANGYEMATRTAVSTSQSIPLQPCKTSSLQVEVPSTLPDGIHLSLKLIPKLDHPRRGRINLDTGRGMMLNHFFNEELPVPASGIVAVPIRWPGSYTVQTLVTPKSGGAWTLRNVSPKEVTLPAAGSVIQINSDAFDKLLERMSK